ncbi:hypothetical protein HYV82_03405 [Candidatus Woesearchaeota archaeon]|nr:hypothetical protein [Candidatus Woesearchaeota archaeon]
MKQKHLFRFALKNVPEGEGTERARALSAELERADEFLARDFALHVAPVDYGQRQSAAYYENARDAAFQLGNSVHVKPGIATHWSNFSATGILPYLIPSLPKAHPFTSSALEKAIRAAGYEGYLHPHDSLSEGGQFVTGEKFCLVTDSYYAPAVRRVAKLTGTPTYQVHSFTSIWHEHIDGDYAVVDDALLLYTSLPVGRPVPAQPRFSDHEEIMRHRGLVSTRHKLERITEETGYELRTYRDKEDNNLGINLLTAEGTVFTTGIHPEEKRFLESRGIRVTEIPLRHTTPGEGLRCLYAELAF